MLGIGIVEEIVTWLVILLILGFNIAMITKAATNPRLSEFAKVCWCIAIILFTPFAGLYYFYWASLYKRDKSQNAK
jgi:membrane protein implicated in regulation of membrane protease activity